MLLEVKLLRLIGVLRRDCHYYGHCCCGCCCRVIHRLRRCCDHRCNRESRCRHWFRCCENPRYKVRRCSLGYSCHRFRCKTNCCSPGCSFRRCSFPGRRCFPRVERQSACSNPAAAENSRAAATGRPRCCGSAGRSPLNHSQKILRVHCRSHFPCHETG